MNHITKIFALLLCTASWTLSTTVDSSASQTTTVNDNLSSTPAIESLYNKENSSKEIGKIYNDKFAALFNNQNKTARGYAVTNNPKDALIGYTQAIDSQQTITYNPQYGTAMRSKDFINQLQSTTKVMLDTQMDYYILQNIIHDLPGDGYYIVSHTSTAVEYDSPLSYLGNYQNEKGVIYFVYGERVPESRYNHVAKTIEHHQIIDAENNTN